MNKEEYNLLQSKVKESGRTQQEVVIKAIADLKIASAEETKAHHFSEPGWEESARQKFVKNIPSGHQQGGIGE